MKPNLLTVLIITTVLLQVFPNAALSQQVYKWTDAAGQVHYGQQKPGDAATPAETVDIAPSPTTTSSDADSAAEIARINTLANQMARDRQATEQSRQEQAIRRLEQENQQLQNDLLKKQQQEQNDNSNVIVGPSPYPYYPYPYPPGPPLRPPGPPCQPWPDCHSYRPMPLPDPPKPTAKQNPIFRPAPSGVSREQPGSFSGR